MHYRHYDIVKADTLNGLNVAVTKEIERGYHPIGGVSQVHDQGQTWVVQAMGIPDDRVEDKLKDVVEVIKNLTIKRRFF